MLFQTFIVFYVLCLNFTVFIMSAAAFMKILEFYIEIAMLQLFSSLVFLFYNYLSINITLHRVNYVWHSLYFEGKWQVWYHIYKRLYKCFYLWTTADNAYITDILNTDKVLYRWQNFSFLTKVFSLLTRTNEQPVLTNKKKMCMKMAQPYTAITLLVKELAQLCANITFSGDVLV